MSEPRAIEICANCGIFGETRADRLRAFEAGLEILVTERGFDRDDPLMIEIRRLVSEQICGLEVSDNFLVVGPRGKIFRVTKEE